MCQSQREVQHLDIVPAPLIGLLGGAAGVRNGHHGVRNADRHTRRVCRDRALLLRPSRRKLGGRCLHGFRSHYAPPLCHPALGVASVESCPLPALSASVLGPLAWSTSGRTHQTARGCPLRRGGAREPASAGTAIFAGFRRWRTSPIIALVNRRRQWQFRCPRLFQRVCADFVSVRYSRRTIRFLRRIVLRTGRRGTGHSLMCHGSPGNRWSCQIALRLVGTRTRCAMRPPSGRCRGNLRLVRHRVRSKCLASPRTALRSWGESSRLVRCGR